MGDDAGHRHVQRQAMSTSGLRFFEDRGDEFVHQVAVRAAVPPGSTLGGSGGLRQVGQVLPRPS